MKYNLDVQIMKPVRKTTNEVDSSALSPILFDNPINIKKSSVLLQPEITVVGLDMD